MLWGVLGLHFTCKIDWKNVTTYVSLVSNSSSRIERSGDGFKHFLSQQENVYSKASKCFPIVFDISEITQDIVHQVANSKNDAEIMSHILRYEKLLSALSSATWAIHPTG